MIIKYYNIGGLKVELIKSRNIWKELIERNTYGERLHGE
jgi:hypothetical protein